MRIPKNMSGHREKISKKNQCKIRVEVHHHLWLDQHWVTFLKRPQILCSPIAICALPGLPLFDLSMKTSYDLRCSEVCWHVQWALVCLFIVGGTGLTLIPSWGVSQKSYWTREGAWPSGRHIGFAIRRPLFQVPLWPVAGFFLCCPEFKSLAMLVNSQPVASFQFGFLFLLCSLWIICF